MNRLRPTVRLLHSLRKFRHCLLSLLLRRPTIDWFYLSQIYINLCCYVFFSSGFVSINMVLWTRIKLHHNHNEAHFVPVFFHWIAIVQDSSELLLSTDYSEKKSRVSPRFCAYSFQARAQMCVCVCFWPECRIFFFCCTHAFSLFHLVCFWMSFFRFICLTVDHNPWKMVPGHLVWAWPQVCKVCSNQSLTVSWNSSLNVKSRTCHTQQTKAQFSSSQNWHARGNLWTECDQYVTQFDDQ